MSKRKNLEDKMSITSNYLKGLVAMVHVMKFKRKSEGGGVTALQAGFILSCIFDVDKGDALIDLMEMQYRLDEGKLNPGVQAYLKGLKN